MSDKKKMDSAKDSDPDNKKKTEKEDEKKNSQLLPVSNDSVKSIAIVKYSTAEAPASYIRLRCNTNLNLPPSNWLSSSTETYGLQPSLLHRSGFSSFRIAHMFPDCIGQVDVVSDAENIKKLLKIPYSGGSVSMIIHRVENTLLIDEFDIHKYLLREAEDQWEWFKKFFYEHIVQPVSKKDILVHKDNSRNALQQKSLASKFLYHSLVIADNTKKDGEKSKPVDPSIPIPLPYKKLNPSLPEPKLEEEVPDPTSDHKFSRNVVWTFEDIQMLLGTDMPIFGGGTHPCISLRLRDMTKPINVLTGMDYWLDNLMCNVPEVVMCYHLNGIVQKYELVKTEDLPHLENSKFSPKLIRDVAQNILSFLKANATKAGHTYWLFKGKDDDVVKLYDLTSLCTDVMDEKGQTPFTVPVAMLLYRVARNMKNSPDRKRQAATIRMLLQNCIALLTPEKYAGIVTSAHYMMADLYIPAEVNPKSPELVIDEEESQTNPGGNMQNEEEEESEHEEEEEEDTKRDESQTNPGGNMQNEEEEESEHEEEEEEGTKRDEYGVKSLSLSNISEIQVDEAEYIPPSPPPIGNDVLGRCFDGIKHVVKGLHSLKFLAEIESKDQKKQENGKERKEPGLKKKSKTVPNSNQPLNPTGQDTKKKRKRKGKQVDEEKNLMCKPRFDAVASWQNPNPKSFTWNVHLKTLLYEKAYLIYATLVERSYADEKYGLWLHYIKMVLKIRKILKTIRPDLYSDDVESYFVGPAGDAFFMIVQNSADIEIYNRDYMYESDFDRDIQTELESLGIAIPDENENLFPLSLYSVEELLLCSYNCYKRAMASKMESSEYKNLQRHLGNILNELGVFYMNQAAAKFQDMGTHTQDNSALFKEYCSKSRAYLDEGIRAFDVVKDKANLALLHSNIGRLMRLRAHFHGPNNEFDDEEKKKELAGREKYYYSKAIASYQKALQVLGDRKYNLAVWDSVNWELSTALYSMACFLQDYPIFSKTQDEATREVTETLHKALKYCDSDIPGPRQPVYQFRNAMIHHRLGSLYFKMYRTICQDESRRKKIVQLCKIHYEKSAAMYLYLEHPAEYLRVQLERVSVSEFQAENVTSISGKIKHLENALDLSLEAKVTFKLMMDGEAKSNDTEEAKAADKGNSVRNLALEGYNTDEAINEMSLLALFKQRLQFILFSLTKLTFNRVEGKKGSNPAGEKYKNLYAMILKKEIKEQTLVEQGKWFYSLVSDISNIVNASR